MLKSVGIQVLYVQDILLLPLYLFMILLFAWIYQNVAYKNSRYKGFFLPGLLAKIMGGLAMGAVYIYYYDGGDTFYYYYDSKTFSDAMQQSFGLFLKLLMLPANSYQVSTYDSISWLVYFNDPSGWTADKVYGILSIFSFHSYVVMTVLIATLTFSGAWAMFRTFTELYPSQYKQFAMAILFVPSVVFWGSGILKDSITFGCLGWMTYTSYLIFFKGKNVFKNSLLLLFTAYLAIQLKAYIVISFVPAVLFWIFFTYRTRIANQFLRMVIGPALFAFSLLLGFFMVQKLGEQFSKFSLQNVMDTAEMFQRWHGYLAETSNASGYSLGTFDGTLFSLLLKFPAAVNVTLFRPYLWEVNNVVMLAAALESMFIFGFTLYILIRNGVLNTIQSIFSNPNIFFCFFFSIVFAFAVGFSSYNFGALVRYKIPCIPFFLVGLIILNQETTQKRIAKERERNRNRFRRKEKLQQQQPALSDV